MILGKTAPLLTICFLLSSCKLKLKDCVDASPGCCDLVVGNMNVTKKLFSGNCEHYWNNREEIIQNLNFKNFHCNDWICECPNIEQKIEEESRDLTRKHANEYCKGSQPQPFRDHTITTTSSGLLCIWAFLTLYAGSTCTTHVM